MLHLYPYHTICLQILLKIIYQKVYSSIFLPNLVLRSFLSLTHEPIKAYPWMAFDLH